MIGILFFFQERLLAIPENILLSEEEENLVKGRDLVIGAIELAYRQMDQMVELQAQNGGGGCTAISVLFLNGRLYAAGAGDSRFFTFLFKNSTLTRFLILKFCISFISISIKLFKKFFLTDLIY